MLKYWVAANMVEGVGPVKLKKLLDQHGSIVEVCKIIDAPLEKAQAIILQAKEKGISILSLEDKPYPSSLKNIHDPPPVLYFRGDSSILSEKAIAIVGTRRASRYGKTIAKNLAAELSNLGLTIISGMALGIDSAAHAGALDHSGRTIAVLGCGVDIVYPPGNKSLMESIMASGAVVSEFSPGTEPENWRFPQRNRIISGLSLGVIVVEGHYDSGAMITAKLALDQGREVFAVPGNIELDQSKGPHWLIKQGAKLVESVDDVLEELNMIMPESRKPSAVSGKQIDYSILSKDEQKIVSVLSLDPKHIDIISTESGLSIPQVSSLLMLLEIKTVVRQLPGKMFVLY